MLALFMCVCLNALLLVITFHLVQVYWRRLKQEDTNVDDIAVMCGHLFLQMYRKQTNKKKQNKEEDKRQRTIGRGLS